MKLFPPIHLPCCPITSSPLRPLPEITLRSAVEPLLRPLLLDLSRSLVRCWKRVSRSAITDRSWILSLIVRVRLRGSAFLVSSRLSVYFFRSSFPWSAFASMRLSSRRDYVYLKVYVVYVRVGVGVWVCVFVEDARARANGRPPTLWRTPYFFVLSNLKPIIHLSSG